MWQEYGGDKVASRTCYLRYCVICLDVLLEKYIRSLVDRTDLYKGICDNVLTGILEFARKEKA